MKLKNKGVKFVKWSWVLIRRVYKKTYLWNKKTYKIKQVKVLVLKYRVTLKGKKIQLLVDANHRFWGTEENKIIIAFYKIDKIWWEEKINRLIWNYGSCK